MKTVLRSIRPAFVAVVALMAAATARGEAGESLKLPMPVMKTLPNGLRVAWLEAKAVPVVDFVLLSDHGSYRDPEGKSGTASLAVAAWRRPDREGAIRRLGASWGAAFDGDQITLSVEGLASERPALLEDFLSTALRPDFTEDDVRIQRERLSSAWVTAHEQPEEIAQAFFERLALRATPYWRGGLSGPTELNSITRRDLQGWHAVAIEPSRVLVLGTGPGNAEAFFEEVGRIARELAWKATPSNASAAEVKSASPARRDPSSGDGPAWLKALSRGSFRHGKQKKVDAPFVLLVDRPGAPQAHLRVGTRAPAFGDADRIPLGLANGALGETFESRLNREVRDGLGLVYAMSSGFAWRREAALFGVSLATPPQGAGIVLKKVLEVLARAGGGDFTEAEIEEARGAAIGGYPLQFPGNLEIAMRWLATIVDRRDPSELTGFPARARAVTLEQVNEAARRYWGIFSPASTSRISDGAAWIVVSGDGRSVGESLLKAGFPKSSILRTSFAELEPAFR